MLCPDFRLQDQNSNYRTPADFIGKWLIVYVYPKDETAGCTAEACSFRDAYADLKQLSSTGVQIVGISPDSVVSHNSFAKHHNLNFILLSDPDHSGIEAFGAWENGRLHRNTVIINPHGEIIKTYKDVDPRQHAAEIMKDLKTLQASHMT